MALQSFQLDPTAGGVSQATFDAHTHNYRKITTLGVDANKAYGSAVEEPIVDDAQVIGTDGTDLEAVAITVATSPTTTPV